MKSICIKVPSKLVEAMKEKAKENDTSMAEVIRSILFEYQGSLMRAKENKEIKEA